MRKTLCTTFISFILMSLLCATASAASFNDVPSSFWANKEITWASERGLMNGTTTTTFNPTGKTLRGQMTAILYRYAGSPAVEQATVYSDVNSSHYYSDAAIWAVDNEIMEETRLVSKTLDAGDSISRAEFCTMLLMFSIYSDTYVAPSAGTLFTDTDDLSDTMQWAIEWANCHGIVNGTSTTTFNPHGTLTRAAAAAMLYRYESYANYAKGITSRYHLAQTKAEELVNLYACTSPKMIMMLLVDTFGFSGDQAIYGVESANVGDKWKVNAIGMAEDFFLSAPSQPTKEEVLYYLTGSQGFSKEIAEYAVEAANIDWNANASSGVYDWISLTDLKKFGFTANAAWGTVALRYLTNETYVITGLPSTVSSGDVYFLDFNGDPISCMYYRRADDLSSHPDSCFYLDKHSLVRVGILTENGVSDAIRNGIPQEGLLVSSETGAKYPSTGASASSGSSSSSDGASSSGSASVTVPSHSETEGNLVWVPTNGGTKYHSRSGCSQMENPIQVSIETAKAHGYTACGRCH